MFCSCAPFCLQRKSIVVVRVPKAYIGEPHRLTRRVNGFGGWNVLDYGQRTTDFRHLQCITAFMRMWQCESLHLSLIINHSPLCLLPYVLCLVTCNLPLVTYLIFCITINPSRIGNSTFSTRGSACTISLNS